MKKLILSLDTYSWVKYCAGMISREPENFSVVIVYRDDYTPMYGCNPNLCPKAIYEQRIHDLFRIGKELGIKRILSLNYDVEYPEIEKLIMHLQLYISIGGVTEVYFQPDEIIDGIIKEIVKKLNIELFSYIPSQEDEKISREIILDASEISKKFKLRDYMIGVPESFRKSLVEYGSEYFYKR